MNGQAKPIPKIGTPEFREWLNEEIYQTLEEIRLLEQERSKIMQKLGIWPYLAPNEGECE